MTQKMWTDSTAWRFLSAVLQVLFVLYVFSRLDVRFEIIVVAILGLIYASIRGLDAALAPVLANIIVRWEKDFIAIRKHIGDDDGGERETEVPVPAAERALRRVTFTSTAIELITLWLITLICLYELFTAL
jgi:hypothetical protein